MRIAIIESQSLVRHGLVRALSSDAGVRIVIDAADEKEFFDASPDVDIVFYGPRVPDELTLPFRQLVACHSVLLMCASADPAFLVRALRAGVVGCLTRDVDDDELKRALQTVSHGGMYLSAGLTTALRHGLSRVGEGDPGRELGRRELETLRFIAQGLTHAQIGRRMGVTEATVSTYAKRIRFKLNVGNKADLTRRAIELGLLQDARTPAHREHYQAPYLVADRLAG